MPLAGVPLNVFGPTTIGDADTIVRRPSGITVPPPGMVPIELVALNLVSVQPITVTYTGGSNPELWDVAVTKAANPPSQGQLAITPTGPTGGTFDSQFSVFPLLTFTRYSDGAVRTSTPPAPFQFDTAGNPPWRAGCLPPALRRAGVNDGFCPGLTPTLNKAIAIHQATNPSPAQHAVYPAQAALEHFKCYAVTEEPFTQVTVNLTDQFGSRNTNVLRRAELCNPVRKNAEPWINQRAHLQCYVVGGPAVNQVRPVRNQLGSQQLRVLRPQRLCATSEKRKVPGQFAPIPDAFRIDHFQCYGVEPVTPLQSANPIPQVNLEDQFGVETNVVIGPALRLCVPVQKIHGGTTPIRHPVQHLVCYKIVRPVNQQNYAIRNQFEQRALRTIRPNQLCVPSAKGPPLP